MAKKSSLVIEINCYPSNKREKHQISSRFAIHDPDQKVQIQPQKKGVVLRLQHFYNKSWVISYYWFKFEFSIEITFLTQQ